MHIGNLHDPELNKKDLLYWLSKSPEERIKADILRRQYHGNLPRLQRSVKIIHLHEKT